MVTVFTAPVSDCPPGLPLPAGRSRNGCRNTGALDIHDPTPVADGLEETTAE
ncbi:hypothetical protein GCM10010505_36080 [Kitasatospora aburaviensis]